LHRFLIFLDNPAREFCAAPDVSFSPLMIVHATRSVLSSMRVMRQDLEAWLTRFPNVMDLDPVATSCRLTRRPASIHGGKFIWPSDLLVKLVSALPAVRRDGTSSITVH
jgi:hypothetical protein